MGRLFWKIFLAFWLALVAAAVGAGSMVWLQRHALEGTEGELALAPPHRLAVDMAAATLRHGGVEALREWMKGTESEAAGRPRPVPLLAVDEDGADLLGRTVPRSALALARSLTAKPGGEPGVRLVQAPDGKKYLLFVPSSAAARPPPHPEIVYKGPQELSAEGLPPRAEMARRGPPPPWELILLGVATSLAFSAALAWYLARPIRSLRWAFDAAASGRLDARVTPRIGRRRDEIADLGRDFDRMAERLQASIGAQKRLLHDVSHELRSPLARLQAAIGLLQHKEDPANLETSLARIEKESARLDAMIGEVLTLARLEDGNLALGGESVDVAELMGEIAEDAKFEAEAQKKNLIFESAPEAHVRGSADIVYRAIENVVRNAVKYTPEGATVAVSLRRDGPEVCITVSDAGPGIPAGDLEHIFEPFYRGRSERDGGGFGLGLAIAHRAVAAHGGRITVANVPAGGLQVEIRLPAFTNG